MNNQIAQALKKIKNLPDGEAIFNDNQRFKAVIADLLPGTSDKKLREIVVKANEFGVYKYLQRSAPPADVAERFANEEYLDKNFAREIVDAFAAALGLQVNVTPAPAPPKPIPVSAPPPVSPVVAPPPVSHPDVAPPSADTLTFGKFGGKPIEWRICEVSSDKKWAYILSKDILFQMRYNESVSSCTWETCTLRGLLNGVFLGNFTSQEQSKIGITTVQNENNQWYGIKGGNETKDRIFLPSISEVVKYFGDSGQLKNKNPNSEYWIDDQYNKERIANFNGSPNWWWLRSPGTDFDAAYVYSDGRVYVNGDFVHHNDGGVRPALWLNL